MELSFKTPTPTVRCTLKVAPVTELVVEPAVLGGTWPSRLSVAAVRGGASSCYPETESILDATWPLEKVGRLVLPPPHIRLLLDALAPLIKADFG